MAEQTINLQEMYNIVETNNIIYLVFQVFSAKVDCPRIPVAVSEFQRTEFQSPLSALFLLIRKSKLVRRL